MMNPEETQKECIDRAEYNAKAWFRIAKALKRITPRCIHHITETQSGARFLVISYRYTCRHIKMLILAHSNGFHDRKGYIDFSLNLLGEEGYYKIEVVQKKDLPLYFDMDKVLSAFERVMKGYIEVKEPNNDGKPQ